MSAENEKEIPVAYEQLEELEDDFEDVELEMRECMPMERSRTVARPYPRLGKEKNDDETDSDVCKVVRQQYNLSKDLYVKREKVVSQIPGFWPLVVEQCPPDIDEYIQPQDANVFMTSLTGLKVDRFELPSGDPRSISIRFEFSENEYFEDRTLEKKFRWRYAKDGWAGLISEPVPIKWKEGKDLTNGMLDLVCKVYQEDQASAKPNEETELKKELKKQMDNTGLDGLSFFAWFGFRGRNISDDEHKEALKKEEERRKARKEGKKIDEEDMEDDDDDDEYEWEIFPTADDLAVCIAEDLYPSAIKYFLAAQEQDGLSDLDFEDDEEDSDEEMGDSEDQPPKKRKA
ncbi:Nucleosome assembly protein (NAP) [Geosmithia morbida]|uniref:Nucleosome assembly protein (NAP) n=1 Tax=Geosmithia morbida TaxID=1094350 RepID=A0A9P4YPK6_9HYPO|nr:Nucleosome assembly protein (NAP) [Geosmithia morbida]KAF4120222.1 Nucleosome assembly protein (NAP) [Geosmithia morbida]